MNWSENTASGVKGIVVQMSAEIFGIFFVDLSLRHMLTNDTLTLIVPGKTKKVEKRNENRTIT